MKFGGFVLGAAVGAGVMFVIANQKQNELLRERDRCVQSLGEAGAMSGHMGQRNPWAICTASVGRSDRAKYERCVRQVKAER